MPDPETTPPVQLHGKPVSEKIVEEIVVNNLPKIERGLTLEQRQMETPAGRIDLLCKDMQGGYVVIEIKKRRGQIRCCTDRTVAENDPSLASNKIFS